MAVLTNQRTGRKIQTNGPLGGRLLRANIRRNADQPKVVITFGCMYCGSTDVAHARTTAHLGSILTTR